MPINPLRISCPTIPIRFLPHHIVCPSPMTRAASRHRPSGCVLVTQTKLSMHTQTEYWHFLVLPSLVVQRWLLTCCRCSYPCNCLLIYRIFWHLLIPEAAGFQQLFPGELFPSSLDRMGIFSPPHLTPPPHAMSYQWCGGRLRSVGGLDRCWFVGCQSVVNCCRGGGSGGGGIEGGTRRHFFPWGILFARKLWVA